MIRDLLRRAKRDALRLFAKPASELPLERRVIRAMRLYERQEGHSFDLTNPRAFTEKRLWYALFYEHPDMPRIYDKYLFKGYIEEKLGPGYTAQLYGMWTNMRDFKRDWDHLPDEFCLKSNCSTLGRNFKIVRGKGNVNRQALYREVREWLKPWSTGLNNCNRAYSGITQRIIAEKILTGNHGQLYDYKVMCFDGKPDHFLATAERFPLEAHRLSYTFYDLAWNKLPVTTPGYRNVDIPKPVHLEEMIELSRTLSQGFPHVRVDFYDATDGVYVGELTFYSSPNYDQKDWDLKLGEKFILPDLSAEAREGTGA